MLCAPYQIDKYSGDRIKGDDMGGECNRYEGKEKCIQGFGGGS
jgi:hypothetical protein